MEVGKIGAYYEFQIKRENGTMTNIHPFELKRKVVSNEDIWFGQKFLESFYSGNWFTGCLYGFLKLNKRAIVNTVCDYDDFSENPEEENIENTFKYMQEYGNIPRYTKKELEEFQEVTNDLNFDKKIAERYKEAIIACPEKKQYFVFKEFVKEDEMTVEPLALLTRSGNESQGGGDFDVDYVNNKEVREFKQNPNFDKKLISSWKDLEVEYLTEIPQDYEDITEKIKLISIW